MPAVSDEALNNVIAMEQERKCRDAKEQRDCKRFLKSQCCPDHQTRWHYFSTSGREEVQACFRCHITAIAYAEKHHRQTRVSA